MSNFVYPTSTTTNNADGVNLDNVAGLQKDEYFDKVDKNLNRYYINFTIQDKTVVQWAYTTYEKRDDDYKYIKEKAVESDIDFSFLEASIDSLIRENIIRSNATTTSLTNITKLLLQQNELLTKILS